MPTAFAHALAGGALASCLPEAQRGRRLILGLAAVAVLPDADVVGFWFGVPYDHPLGHRGFSHSLSFAVVVGCIAPLLLHRSQTTRTRLLLGCGYAAATASHGALDAFTDGGLGVGFWIPFSDDRVFAGFRPIMTSSLNPAHVFGARGIRVLANEALWIGLPVVASLALVRLARAALAHSRH
jgi:inner membrane protein